MLQKQQRQITDRPSSCISEIMAMCEVKYNHISYFECGPILGVVRAPEILSFLYRFPEGILEHRTSRPILLKNQAEQHPRTVESCHAVSVNHGQSAPLTTCANWQCSNHHGPHLMYRHSLCCGSIHSVWNASCCQIGRVLNRQPVRGAQDSAGHLQPIAALARLSSPYWFRGEDCPTRH